MNRLTRSKNRIFGGVLGGIANYFRIDPVWMRLLYLLFALFINFGMAFIIYIIALVIIPRGDHEISSENRVNDGIEDFKDSIGNRKVFALVGIVLIVIGTIFLIEQIGNIPIWLYVRSYYYEVKKFVIPTVLILVGAWILVKGIKNK